MGTFLYYITRDSRESVLRCPSEETLGKCCYYGGCVFFFLILLIVQFYDNDSSVRLNYNFLMLPRKRVVLKFNFQNPNSYNIFTEQYYDLNCLKNTSHFQQTYSEMYTFELAMIQSFLF